MPKYIRTYNASKNLSEINHREKDNSNTGFFNNWKSKVAIITSLWGSVKTTV